MDALWDYLEKLEEPMLKKVIKEDFMVENKEKRSIIEGLKKGMKPTRKK